MAEIMRQAVARGFECEWPELAPADAGEDAGTSSATGQPQQEPTHLAHNISHRKGANKISPPPKQPKVSVSVLKGGGHKSKLGGGQDTQDDDPNADSATGQVDGQLEANVEVKDEAADEDNSATGQVQGDSATGQELFLAEFAEVLQKIEAMEADEGLVGDNELAEVADRIQQLAGLRDPVHMQSFIHSRIRLMERVLGFEPGATPHLSKYCQLLDFWNFIWQESLTEFK